jgi:hypothetical protein
LADCPGLSVFSVGVLVAVAVGVGLPCSFEFVRVAVPDEVSVRVATPDAVAVTVAAVPIAIR